MFPRMRRWEEIVRRRTALPCWFEWHGNCSKRDMRASAGRRLTRRRQIRSNGELGHEIGIERARAARWAEVAPGRRAGGDNRESRVMQRWIAGGLMTAALVVLLTPRNRQGCRRRGKRYIRATTARGTSHRSHLLHAGADGRPVLSPHQADRSGQRSGSRSGGEWSSGGGYRGIRRYSFRRGRRAGGRPTTTGSARIRTTAAPRGRMRTFKFYGANR